MTATDLFYLCSMDRREANVLYPLAQYLFRHAEGRKSSARLSGGHFIWHLAHHFSLVSNDGLRGLSVVTCEIPLIDMGELVKLNICMDVVDDWAWAALGPEMHLSHHHLQLQVGLCPRDLGDLRWRYKDYNKTNSKFNIIVREYVTEPNTLSKLRAELRRESVYKSVEPKGKV
nr:hypothetical protein [Tanacetum cinerariifolium]